MKDYTEQLALSKITKNRSIKMHRGASGYGLIIFNNESGDVGIHTLGILSFLRKENYIVSGLSEKKFKAYKS